MKNPFGLKNGKLITIEEVKESGLSCDCYCPDPNCNDRLIAKRSNVRINHFAHAGKEKKCYGLETALHLVGKEIILKHKKLLIPNLDINIDLSEHTMKIAEDYNYQFKGFSKSLTNINNIIFEEKIIEFENVFLEK